MLLGNNYRNKLHMKTVSQKKKKKHLHVIGATGYRCLTGGRTEVVPLDESLPRKTSFRNSDEKN